MTRNAGWPFGGPFDLVFTARGSDDSVPNPMQ